VDISVRNIKEYSFIHHNAQNPVSSTYLLNCELPEDGAVLAPKHVGATITFQTYLLINAFCWFQSILIMKMNGLSYKKFLFICLVWLI
jgi:hypothetical protein